MTPLPRLARSVYSTACFALACAAPTGEPPDDGGPQNTLTALAISPTSASLTALASQQFVVDATWNDGGSATPTVVYSATGGMVTAGGLYTAGETPGEYRVVALHQESGVADTASITITVASGNSLANECASPEPGWIWCDDFDVDRLSSYFEYENPSNSFLRVDGVGVENSFGMRAQWSVGQQFAGALHLAIGRTPQDYFRPADAGTADYRELYWRVYLRHQPGWTGGGGDKLSRAFVFASPSSYAQAMIAHVWSGEDNSAFENVLMLDPARGTDEDGVLLTDEYNDFEHLTWLGLVHGSNTIFASTNVGTWYCIEARARLNDPGLSNGVTQLWVNGTLDASRTGLNFLGSFDAYGLNAVYVENFWNEGSPVEQERYIDNFVVSTQPIGC